MISLKFEPKPGILKLPNRFLTAAFDGHTNEALKEIAEEFIENFAEYYVNGIAPAFFGPPGIGKTHVAAVIAKLLHNKQGVPVYWADTVQTLNKIMDYRDFRNSAYFRIKKDLTQIPLVVLDDFGHMQDFTRTRELFFEIVNTRYSRKLPTIFTANISAGVTQESWEQLDNICGSAVTRRIKVMSKGLLFVGGLND